MGGLPSGGCRLEPPPARLELAVHTGRINRFQELRPELAMNLDVRTDDFPGENVDVGGRTHAV
jgi:hypothetical protein